MLQDIFRTFPSGLRSYNELVMAHTGPSTRPDVTMGFVEQV